MNRARSIGPLQGGEALQDYFVNAHHGAPLIPSQKASGGTWDESGVINEALTGEVLPDSFINKHHGALPAVERGRMLSFTCI